jgi:Holliday junction DNA helicase RuvA
MIALINGRLVYKSVSCIIVETNGVGYHVYVPLTTFYELPDTNHPVTLHIHTQVRADAINLFGFHTAEEKDVFQLMISVSGIGPKLAMNILSGITAAEFKRAVVQGDLGRLVSIPGVGKKTAERMVVELKDKVLKLDSFIAADVRSGETQVGETMKNDALSALINLGYRSNTARSVIDTIIRGSAETLTLDVLLKKALKHLSR